MKMYLLLKMVVFQPAMLVYQRVVVRNFTPFLGLGCFCHPDALGSTRGWYWSAADGESDCNLLWKQTRPEITACWSFGGVFLFFVLEIHDFECVLHDCWRIFGTCNLQFVFWIHPVVAWQYFHPMLKAPDVFSWKPCGQVLNLWPIHLRSWERQVTRSSY